MGRMDELLEVTEKIVELLNEPIKSNDERIEIIEKLNELLETRQTILEKVVAPYTEDEKKIGTKIITLDQKIQEKMETLYGTIRKDLQQLKQKKGSNLSYINPYGKMETVDGMYLDDKL